MTRYRDSRESTKDYFNWRLERAKPVVYKINKLRNLKGKRVLEIGCGYGSLMSLLADFGAKAVGVEVNQKSIDIAKRYLKGKKNLQIIRSKGGALNLQDDSFDVVILFDVIEHVQNPQKVVGECIRVLKTGGILYSEFTPFYSLIGHHLYDITKLPIHLLPDKYVKKIVYGKKMDGIFSPEEYWNDYKGLNKLKISQFQEYVHGLQKVEERYIFKYPDLFEINLSILSYLGNLKDILTLSFEGIYEKEELTNSWEERARKYRKDIRGVLFKKPYPDWINKWFHSWSLKEVTKNIDKMRRFNVLDVACGWGRVSSELLKKYNNIKINGVDVSKTFVDIYNRDLFPRGKATVASMVDLPYENKKFDFVFLIVSLMYLPTIRDQNRAIKEMFRVLKKGGNFVLIERTPLMGLMDISRKLKKVSNRAPQVSFTQTQIRALIDAVEGKILRQSYWPHKFLPLYVSYTIKKRL